jgi:hypothetical protein
MRIDGKLNVFLPFNIYNEIPPLFHYRYCIDSVYQGTFENIFKGVL